MNKMDLGAFIVPTGLGASIGGYAGDASFWARKFASKFQLIVNPNVVNAGCFSGITENMLYTEGYSIDEVAFPIKVFAMLGIRKLIVSNAAGGLNPRFKVGDLMLITDHINIAGLSPLRGENYKEFGERFPSMTNAYSDRLISLAKEIVSLKKDGVNIKLQEGVYAFMPGPQYETKAEVKMLKTLGADAVGMSTVPEVISATHSGMEVLGISCITNECSADTPPSHEEVIEAAKKAESSFITLVMNIIKDM